MKVPMTDSSNSMNPRGFRPFTGNGKPYVAAAIQAMLG
jgi:hypothetical protein